MEVVKFSLIESCEHDSIGVEFKWVHHDIIYKQKYFNLDILLYHKKNFSNLEYFNFFSISEPLCPCV